MALTWRDVAAPDFRTSLEGYRTFSDMLSTGLNGLSRGLDRFDERQTGVANNQIMLAALRERDPEAFKAALESGSLVQGIDPRRISAETLGFLNNQAGALLNQATAEENLSNLRYNTERVRNTNTRTDAARTAANAYLAAASMGDEGTMREILKSNPALGQLDAGQLQSLVTGGQGLVKGDVDITGGRLDNVGQRLQNERGEWQFDVDKASYADQQAGQAALLDITEQSMSAEDARAAFTSGAYAKLSPGAKMVALQGLNGLYGNIFAPTDLGVSVSGSGGGAGGSFDMGQAQSSVASTLQASGMSAPVVAGFLGNFHVEGGYGGAKGDGGSAAGIAQWRGERQTNFERVIGKPVERATIADQAKFVAWEMQNPKAAGMTVAQRDAILNARTPEEAARLIDKHYERSSGAHTDRRVAAARSAASLLGAATSASTEIAVRARQNDVNSIIPGWEKSMQDNRSLSQISGSLTNGEFKGTDRAWVEEQVNSIYRRSFVNGRPTINYATAGEILKKNIRNERRSDPLDIFSIRPAGTASGRAVRAIDNRGIAADIAQAQRITQGIGQRQGLAAASGAVQAAQADLAQKQAKLNAALQRATTQPGVANQLPRLQADVARSSQRLEGLLRSAASDDTLSSNTPRRAASPSDAVGSAMRFLLNQYN